MLSILKGYIVAITLEATLAGVYFASFLLCLRWLIFSDDGATLRKPIHRPFLIITLVLFVFTVTALGIGLQKALSSSHGASTTGIPTYFIIINFFVEMLTLVITDGVLIFRCWTVYNRSWRIAFIPLLLLLYNISVFLVLTCWHAFYELRGNKPAGPMDDSLGISELFGSLYAANIVINMYTTSAIIFRIWRNSLSRRFARSVIRVIAESGLLYTITSIATLAVVFPHITSSVEHAYPVTCAIV
ncbi:hypothetical protein AX14_012251, partial [Amanita brunnescens Koide BX004]